MAQPIYIAVIGGSDIGPETAALAREVGREVAGRGAVLLCGGLGGVMAAAAQWRAPSPLDSVTLAAVAFR